MRKGGIERAQFAHQQAHGPAIADQVVQGDEQHMVIVGQAQQAAAYQGFVVQIEGCVGFLVGQ